MEEGKANKRIEKALETFGLNADFTHEQLEEAYNLRSKMLYINFEDKIKDTSKREQDSYDYQILLIYEYIREMLKDIDLEKKGLFNVSKTVKEFYGREPNHSTVSQLFDFMSMDIKSLDIGVGTARTGMDLAKAFSEFIESKNESYQMFINCMMYGNNEKIHNETINGESLAQVVSMKELILTVHTILTNKDYMLNDIKTKMEEYYEKGSAEYNLGLNFYMRIKLATYEEAKKIYEEALAQLFLESENKKTATR